MKRKLWLMLLAALGFHTACEENENRMVAMYGCPFMDYEVDGTVTDAEGNPINDIMVQADYGSSTAYTDENGRYTVSGRGLPGRLTLNFVDFDGDENGGNFKSEEVVVDFNKKDLVAEGTGDWDNGDYRRDGVDVTLTRLVEEEE